METLRWHPKQVVGITLGEQGFLYEAEEGMRHIPALPVEVRDTNGAGRRVSRGLRLRGGAGLGHGAERAFCFGDGGSVLHRLGARGRFRRRGRSRGCWKSARLERWMS